MKRQLFPILALMLLSWWSWKPLVSRGFFPIHDDTQVARVVEMGRALRSGQFPVRWVADLGYGYGYPLYNFYGPLPYYLGGFFYLLGLDPLVSTKLMFGAGIILAAFSMYFLVAPTAGRLGGIVAALFYLYAPYHAVQVYVRGAVGELWGFGFLPLLLWALPNAKKPTANRTVLVGLGLAGVILSHTILGFVATTALFLAIVLARIFPLEKFRLEAVGFARKTTISLILGLALSSFFWLPAITEMPYTSVVGQIGPTADFRDHFVCLGQLWNSAWGYGGSTSGCLDGMSFKLGKLQLVIAGFSVLFWLIGRKKLSLPKAHFIYGLVISVGSIFLMTPWSQPVWELIPLAGYIQYPWRFLTFTALGLAVLGGAFMLVLPHKVLRLLVASVLGLGILYYNGKLFQPQFIYERATQSWEAPPELKYRISRISDEYLPSELLRPASEKEIVTEVTAPISGGSVQLDFDIGWSSKLAVESESTQEIKVLRAYFPGWRYWVNGKEVSPRVAGGLPYLTVSPGENVVEIQFRNTPVRTIGNLISVLCLIFLGWFYGKKSLS